MRTPVCPFCGGACAVAEINCGPAHDENRAGGVEVRCERRCAQARLFVTCADPMDADLVRVTHDVARRRWANMGKERARP